MKKLIKCMRKNKLTDPQQMQINCFQHNRQQRRSRSKDNFDKQPESKGVASVCKRLKFLPGRSGACVVASIVGRRVGVEVGALEVGRT